MLDKVRTGQAGAGGVGGGKGALGDEGGEAGAAGRRGPQRAGTEMGRTWVNAAQNKSEGPKDKNKTKKEIKQKKYFLCL